MLFASDIDGKSAGDSREPAKEGAALFSERSEARASQNARQFIPPKDRYRCAPLGSYRVFFCGFSVTFGRNPLKKMRVICYNNPTNLRRQRDQYAIRTDKNGTSKIVLVTRSICEGSWRCLLNYKQMGNRKEYLLPETRKRDRLLICSSY